MHYALTRLGFGSTSAATIMTITLDKVFSLDSDIHCATDHYSDTITVLESIAMASRMQEHLLKNEVESKEPESLDGGQVLGNAMRLLNIW